MNKKTVRKKQVWSGAFLAPALFAVSAVVFIPFLFGIYYGFTKWDGINPAQFIGLENFTRIMKDREFLDSIWFTFRFSIVTIVLINAIGLGLALIVTQNFKGSSLLRTVFFMPNLIGGLILGFIWQFVFIKGFQTFGEFAGIEIMLGWLSTPSTAFWGIVIMVCWQYSGYIMVIYIAFLQGIDTSILEAADLDGASGWQKFMLVKFPMIRPAFTISLFMTLSFCFKIYDQNLSLTAGGPFKSTEMVAMNIVNTAFSQKQMGLAQAKGIVFFVLLTIISVIQVYFSSRKEVEA